MNGVRTERLRERAVCDSFDELMNFENIKSLLLFLNTVVSPPVSGNG